MLRRRGWRRRRWRRPPKVAKVAAARAAEISGRVARPARVGVLLLQRPLLDVVGELGGRHAVRLLPVCLQLRGAELEGGKEFS